jgi:hypothetical protein
LNLEIGAVAAQASSAGRVAQVPCCFDSAEERDSFKAAVEWAVNARHHVEAFQAAAEAKAAAHDRAPGVATAEVDRKGTAEEQAAAEAFAAAPAIAHALHRMQLQVPSLFPQPETLCVVCDVECLLLTAAAAHHACVSERGLD